MLRFFYVEDRTLKRHISIGVFVVYIDTGSSVPGVPWKSRDLTDENNKMLTEWKWFETIVLTNMYVFIDFKSGIKILLYIWSTQNTLHSPPVVTITQKSLWVESNRRVISCGVPKMCSKLGTQSDYEPILHLDFKIRD
jgi:hypothetical protein